jgi:hypothetical protein
MRLWIRALILSLAALAFVAEDKPAAKPPDDQIEKERAATALEMCRNGAKEYRLCLDDPKRTELELKPDPVLRWSNPAVGSIHGGIFIWTHQGRPAAVASVFKWFDPLDHMAFEVHSLSTEKLLGILGTKEAWKPSRAGLEYTPVPGAMAPAGTPAVRLSQMRTMSGAFTADKTDRDDNVSVQQLRLLTQPVFRYTSKEARVTDGALFAFVQGTDPEVLLLLEAQETDTGLVWHYALARMNSTVFKVRYRDQPVWETEVLPWGVVFNNSEPYNILNLDHFYPPKK